MKGPDPCTKVAECNLYCVTLAIYDWQIKVSVDYKVKHDGLSNNVALLSGTGDWKRRRQLALRTWCRRMDSQHCDSAPWLSSLTSQLSICTDNRSRCGQQWRRKTATSKLWIQQWPILPSWWCCVSMSESLLAVHGLPRGNSAAVTDNVACLNLVDGSKNQLLLYKPPDQMCGHVCESIRSGHGAHRYFWWTHDQLLATQYFLTSPGPALSQRTLFCSYCACYRRPRI